MVTVANGEGADGASSSDRTPEPRRELLASPWGHEHRPSGGDGSDASSSLAVLAAPFLMFESRSMRNMIAAVDRAAQSDATVLLRGETGTGKNGVARMVHQRSPRRANRFAVVNCPTLTSDRFAEEMRGEVREDAADQAGQEGLGVLDGGSIFLDEIGELSAPVQAKLLSYLQEERRERRDKGTGPAIDVRLVAATNRNIEADISSGRFRQDLFFRVNVIEIRIPPLRERRDDILPMARRFAALVAAENAQPVPDLSPRVAELLVNYSWPGNIRELRNTIERAIVLRPAARIEADALPERLIGTSGAGPLVGGDYTLEEVEQEHILRVVNRMPTLERAAETLGINYSTLWRKRKRYM